MEDLIKYGSIMTAFYCGILVVYSCTFRAFIRVNAFNGINMDAAKEYQRNLPFGQRLFLTYINKCNPTGKQRKAMAIWLIICHYAHVVAVISALAITWYIFILEGVTGRTIDYLPFFDDSQFADHLLDLSVIVAFVPLPISILVGIFIHLCSKNKIDLQTIKIIRGANPNGVRSYAYDVFTCTRRGSAVRIKENEEKEFKVVKRNQKIWISEAWVPVIRDSNMLYINVQDAIVELEVGCYEDKNLWIREKSQ